MNVRRHRVLAGALGATALAALLVGCGPAPWDAPGASSSPKPSKSATVAAPVPNDLSSGSTQRALQTGAVAATVDYWSDLTMDKWTASAVKPVSLSMVTTITPNDGQKVYLQRATMVAVPGTATEDLDALSAQTDQATVSPGYLVLSPYSYSQTFNVGPVPAEATHVTLQFTYDFLVQTTPTSTEYAKQTATDTLTVAIAATD
ncbi:hypothetical protein [Microbacterium pygmaeum]|uniref:Alternate signal-mediated exported protein, RER_14450 family n=1 Tax=Microbacterium pygmaeum TaxID=370764 RepID=A0A1G7VNN4_9MICO|nr:hypothetical protein [Microbacterium pygmaeum]SDG61383.1 hypothetical protein SAMN04489810_0774 [Microbacterium pygmaeum]